MDDILMAGIIGSLILSGVSMIASSIALRSVLKRDETLMRLQDVLYRQLQAEAAAVITKNKKKEKK